MKVVYALAGAFAIVLLLVASHAKAAAVFYVSNGGSDAAEGTRNAPFATIQKAVDVARSGDTVKVLAGIYVAKKNAPGGGMVVFRNSGTADQPITFEAVGKVIIRGNDSVPYFSGIFEISAKRNGAAVHDLVIRGFRLESSNWFGIHVLGAKNIVLENNYIYETGASGIRTAQSQNITIRGNTLERACISTDKTVDTQEIISLSDVDGFEVVQNHVFNGGVSGGGNGGEGIDAKGASRNGSVHHNLVHDLIRLGIYVDSYNKTAENITVESNTVYKCADGIAVSSERGGTVRRVKIINNILYRNQRNGIIISSWKANGSRRGIEIINNTVFHNGFQTGSRYGGGITLETANASDLIVRNNIVSKNNLWQILINRKASGITVDHNLIDAFRRYADNNLHEEKGDDSINADPLFIDADIGNFRLKANSPAIDAGNNLFAPGADFDNEFRPKNKIADIGAFESRN